MIIFFCWLASIWLLILIFSDLFPRSMVKSSEGCGASEIKRAKQLLYGGATTRQESDQLEAKPLAWPPSMTEIARTA
jgi:hypothetical protein